MELTGVSSWSCEGAGQDRWVVRLPRYPPDLTDSQWTHIKLLLPSQDSRKPKHHCRNLLDAILYVGRASGAWRALPMDFPP